MLIGDVWSFEEERTRQPISGPAGREMDRMLQDAGILRSDCYVTCAVNARPERNDLTVWMPTAKKDIRSIHTLYEGKHIHPIILEGFEQLKQEIDLVGPDLIITFGNLPLWLLTGADSVMKWRGSLLSYKGIRLVPTYHPAAVMKQWELRSPVLTDLRRAAAELTTPAKKPEWNFRVRPSFDTAATTIKMLRDKVESGEVLWVDLDIETRANHIACIGLSWTLLDALVIPLMCMEDSCGYWSLDEEAVLVWMLYKLLTHPNVRVRWQNGLFDAQFLNRYWHFIPTHGQDTMITQHTAFAGQKKSLAYQASLYCDYYVYWKDDGRLWHKDVGEEQLWKYNAEDCVRTREVGEVELKIIENLGLQEPESYQQGMFMPLLKAMVRGIRVDKKARDALANELQQEIDKRRQYFRDILGHDLNPASSPQMVKLFYDDFQQSPIKTRSKKGIPGHLTCDDEALVKMSTREPLLLPLVQAIQEYRSLNVFLSTFVLAGLDVDGKMRCSYNPTGTETFRLSSSKNVFGSGCNLQTIPKGDEKGLLPNIRKLYIPEPGNMIFDSDLDRADLQVVAYEADEPELKMALKKGVDMHLMNAFAITGKEPPDLDWLVESHPEYERIRAGMKAARQRAKMWCHGTNYGGSSRTMAANCGISVVESDRAQLLYFGRYPGIKRWHQRVENDLRTKHCVTNKFGYRRYYFDRVDALLPEALAWIPQSSVGIYINRIWKLIDDNLPSVEINLQVHDSLVGQFPIHKAAQCKADILALAKQVIIPYDDPLIIPLGIKTSVVSWGDVE
jgi:DNA polymerase I - 3''-5'' exonuclease and polymerase domains